MPSRQRVLRCHRPARSCTLLVLALAALAGGAEAARGPSFEDGTAVGAASGGESGTTRPALAPLSNVSAARCDSPEPPSPIPWVLAGAAVLGLVFAATWALRERARAEIVSDELSRIRLHRTAALRVTQPLSTVPPPIGSSAPPDRVRSAPSEPPSPSASQPGEADGIPSN